MSQLILILVLTSLQNYHFSISQFYHQLRFTNLQLLGKQNSNCMGCSQSTNQVNQKNSLNKKDPVLIMVGTSIKGSMVVYFQEDVITSQKIETKIPKFAHALSRSQNIGYLTGGIQQFGAKMDQNVSIEDQAYQGTISKQFFQVDMRKLITDLDNAFTEMPEMINARYSHCALILNNNLYVLGGRQYGDDEKGLLSACQRFDFSQQKWYPTASLRYPRSGGVAILYQSHIYVFGGYTGNNTRNMTIQSFSEGDQTFRKVPFDLHAGLQGLIAIPSPNNSSSIFIFGGRTSTGKKRNVCQMNFDNSTVRCCKDMTEARSFHKAVYTKNDHKVYIFGGGPDNVESYFMKQQISGIQKDISYLQHCSTKDLTSFSHFQYQINLKYKKKSYVSPNYKNKVFIFGHATQPFAKIIDTDSLVVVSENQNLKHKFNQFQTCVRANKETCFIMGGINTDCTAVSDHVYSFSLLNQQIKQLNPMKSARYGFPAVVKGSYLYVIGGRKLGGDQVAILNACQRFSFETYEWESIAPMKYKRHSSFAVVYGNYLFAIGGYKGKGIRSNQIQVYLQNQNKWVQMQEKFELAVESMTPVTYQNSIFLFGGRAQQIDIQKVFKFHIRIQEGVKLQRSITTELQPMGNLTKSGTNLKVFTTPNGLAYIFGNVEAGIDIYDFKKQQVIQTEKLTVFQDLEDKFYQSYTIAF